MDIRGEARRAGPAPRVTDMPRSFSWALGGVEPPRGLIQGARGVRLCFWKVLRLHSRTTGRARQRSARRLLVIKARCQSPLSRPQWGKGRQAGGEIKDSGTQRALR